MTNKQQIFGFIVVALIIIGAIYVMSRTSDREMPPVIEKPIASVSPDSTNFPCDTGDKCI